MATLKTISAALKLVDAKRENLKKAYDDLQSLASLLSPSSFPLTWSNLDSHFTSIHNSLTHRFHHLQQNSHIQNPTNDDDHHPSLPSSSNSKSPHQNPEDANFPPFPNGPTTQNGTKSHYQELTSLCKNMDGKGLRNYIGEHFKDKSSIKLELIGALKCAHDPASLVLDSMDGVVVFGGTNGVKDGAWDVRRMKRSCGVLFQQLRVACPNVSAKVRKRAKKLAIEWKGSLVSDNADAVGAMAFLHFVAAYGLLSELSMSELATFSAMAATNDELPELYQIIGLTDKVPSLVQKLIDKGKYILAVKYVFEFNLADKIPPVPILQAYVNESQKLARRLSQEGKSLNEITAREIHALKSVIKVIENHNLESEFPRASLEQRIEQLKKHKANVKHVAPASAAKPPQHQQQQSGVKRPRISAPVAPAAVPNNVSSISSSMHQYQQPLFQSTGLLPEHSNPYMGLPEHSNPYTGLPEHSNPYMGLPAVPYGIVAPTQTISQFTGPSTGPYGLAGAPMGPSGNPGQGDSYPNSLEPHVPSGYYDGVSAYGGYGLQHHYQTS